MKTAAERFWSKVNKTHFCWEWTASRHPDGYGHFGINGRIMGAHRWAFEQERFPIPEGFELDHLCRNRACVRPDHLEVVSHKTNLLRGVGVGAKNRDKTHCKNGHEFTLENTYRRSDNGGRKCRTCHHRSVHKYYIKNKVN